MIPAIGLTNHYLDSVLRRKLRLKDYGGTFSANRIPKSLLFGRDRCFCIVNTSKEAEAGTHFIVLLIAARRIEIYDSLCLPLNLLFPELIRDLTASKKTVTFKFKKAVQNPLSAFCGFYCIYFCLLLSFEEFPKRSGLKKFNVVDLSNNDKILVSNIKQLIENNE